MLTEDYVNYISAVRRYSPRTVEVYRDSLGLFCDYLVSEGFINETAEKNEGETSAQGGIPDGELLGCLTRSIIRSYEVHLMEERRMSARTVNLHLSVLSGFCSYLVQKERLKSNPVGTVTRPKESRRLPATYRKDALDKYFRLTDPLVEEDMIYVSPEPGRTKEMYDQRLRRLIISALYCTGMRRAELIGLRIKDIDFSRKVAKVLGKGDKMREIPLVDSLLKEISLYLRAVEVMAGLDRTPDSPLLVTFGGAGIYPVFVDRAVKLELGKVGSITGRKSPHVLRHTLATELLDEGTDLNSIKQLLGHSSLAATQVYTHNSIAKLKNVYESAHPRAKNGGKNGD